MEEKLRKTGIEIIGNVPWGTHLCQFYQTEGDLLEVLVPYFQAGLENNEFCLWVTSEPFGEKEARKVMRNALPDFDQYLKKGQIEIIPHNEWYLNDGNFSQQRVFHVWLDKLNQTLTKGYEGMRVSGNTAWLEKKDWKNFTDCEEEIDEVIGKERMMAICTYSLAQCGTSEIIDVVGNHQFALIKQEGKWKLIRSAERKRAEEALLKSEERYRKLVASVATDYIYTVKVENGHPVKTLHGPACVSVTGYTAEEYEANPNLWYEMIYKEDKKAVLEQVEKVLSGERAAPLKHRIIHKNGSIRWIVNTPIARFSEKGQFVAYDGLIADITEHKRAEAEMEYKTIIDTAMDGFWITDMQGRFLDVNDAYCHLIGYSCDELLTMRISDVEAVEKPEETFRRIKKIMEEGRDRFETRHRCKDGRIVDIEVSVNHMGVGGGQLFVFLHDITERKRAEEQLRESEEKFRNLMESIPIGIAVTTPEGVISEANSTLLKIFGYDSKEEFLKSSVSSRYCDARDRERFVKLLKKDGVVKDFEAKFRCKDNTAFWGAISSIAQTTKFGGVRFINAFEDITERKQAEEAIRALSTYNRSLIEASLDPLVTISPEGKIADVNKATELVTGVSREGLIGSDFSDYFTEPEKAREGYRQVFSQGFVRDYPLAIRHSSGKVTEVLYNATVYKNEAGEVQGVFAAARDITERKQAEETISRLAAIVEHSDDAIISKSLDGIILSWNLGAEKLYGFSKEEAVDRSINIIIPPERSEEMPHIFERLKQGERISHYETARKTKDGKKIDISLSISPIRDAAGRIIGASSIARDISERKHNEETIKSQLNEIASYYDNAPIGLGVLDTDLRFIRINNILAEINGISAAEHIGKTVKEITPTLEEQAKKVTSEIIRTGKPITGIEFSGETAKQPGVKHTWLENWHLFKGNDKETIGFMVTVQDITERNRAEEEIKRLNQELERRNIELEALNKELEAFSYSASHDLRAPLRSIDGFSQALLEDYAKNLDSQGEDYLQRVRSASQRMAQLIDDMLKLSKVTRSEINSEPVNLSELVKMIAVELQKTQPEREVEFIITEGMVANGDLRLLRTMCENLLGNAWKFTGKHSRARIEFGVTEYDLKPVYFIRDDGAGFEMEYADKLFVPFQRLHTENEFPGTGIGLATVQRIINRHGGRVWAEGTVEKGATFYFTL